MENAYASMLGALQEKTTTIFTNESDAIKAITDCIHEVNLSLTRLHAWLDSHPFQSPEEEIHFFKHIRPHMDGMRLYYLQLLQLEIRCKAAGQTEKIAIYKRHQQRISNYFDRNSEIYRYHLLSLTYLDGYYYRRPDNSQPESIDDEAPLLPDHRYYATISYKAAKLVCCQLLYRYLERALLPLRPGPGIPGRPAGEGLQWTASKAALGELLYALQEYGVFNNTKVEVKKIADYLEKVFDTDLKNIYKIYEDIRLRKKSRTPFLDALRNSLLRRLDQDDESAL
ncbi:RteC domain-containing protein [Chitinophaga sp. CC14]|uniref:RteC domain-containing protein n=1 Tax=Chitinophaga sp. CC14 TaxID=3029199 RepID=UPI003B7A1695